MGSAAAYYLAKAGAKTLVLEQFSRGHTFGSSHGNTRIIRMVYEKPFYTELMKASYVCWRNLEQASGKNLLFVTGSVVIAPDGHEYLINTRASLEKSGIESEWLDNDELASRLPQFNVEAGGLSVLWQRDGGFLHASECVSTHLKLAEELGAEVKENTLVDGVDWEQNYPQVYAKGERFRGKKVVFAVGPWTGGLLSNLSLPLVVTRQQVVYFRPAELSQFQADCFPVFIDVTRRKPFYGVPDFEGQGMKVGWHGLGLECETSLDTCNRTPDTGYIDFVHDFVRERMPNAAGNPIHAEVCLYTETPDEDFIIGLHPDYSNLVIAGGFSGHGFKFSGLVGKILSEIALTGQTSYDISQFRPERFRD